MYYHERLPNGAELQGKKQGVFCLFYSRDSMPYRNYSEVNDPNQIIPEVLILMNWRSGLSFVGGTVDDEIEKYGFKEGLLSALKREVVEEIGYDLDLSKLSDIICTHNLDDFVVHLFAYELSQSELESIQDNFRLGSHSRAEVAGLNLLQCANFGKNGLPVFLKHNLQFAVREELMITLKELEIVSEEELQKACEIAGYNLQDLLGESSISVDSNFEEHF